MMLPMSMSVEITMVTPARPLADALSDILQRWEMIGYTHLQPAYSMSEEEEVIDFSGDWVARVNALKGLTFGAHRVGPPIDAFLSKEGPGILQSGFIVSRGL